MKTTAVRLASILLAILAASPGLAGDPIIFKKNGGYNWFIDPRAILDGDKVLIGSVAGTSRDGSNAGDVQVTAFDLLKNAGSTVTLAPAFLTDDHATPAMLRRTDGRYIVAFSKHDVDGLMRWSVSAIPGDASSLGPVQTVNGNIVDNYGMCFANLVQVETAGRGGAAATRIYNFARGPGDDPNFLLSDDSGLAFRYGGRVMTWDNADPKLPGRPYIKYAASGSRIWMACTEDHPSELPAGTGIYAGFIRNELIYTSAGGRSVGGLALTNGATTIKPTDLTRVFEGKPDAIAYINDLKVGPDGKPALTFSVRKDDGHDLRYWFARFDGRDWHPQEIARAGSTVYMGEANYAGLAAIDNYNPWTVFISANSDPKTGAEVKSSADGKRHFEIYRGTSTDQGATWKWEAMTSNSSADNIRPYIPARADNRRVVLWLRGTMTTYKDYSLDIVGTVEPDAPKMTLPLHMLAKISASPKTDSTLAANARTVDARAAQDGLEPRSSNDNRPLSHFDWWPDHNTNAWVQYDWPTPVTLTSTEVYWWDDTGTGECRTPKSWKALYKDGDQWNPVETSDLPGTERDKFNKINFKPVTATAIRLEIQFTPVPEGSRARLSCGIQEWKVNGE